MPLGESPAVARRRVRLALRGAREGKGLTQGQVAKALDWSLSKVQRIESGEVSVSIPDLRALLAYLDVTDDDTIVGLMDDARTSRRQRWFSGSAYREHLTPATLRLLQFESEARRIQTFAPVIMPGLLQIPEYARETIRSGGAKLTPEAVQARFDARMHRFPHVFERTVAPEYTLILDESVLLREVGGPRVTARQLGALLALMARDRVEVRVLGFAQTAAIALLGPFTLLTLGDADNVVLYRENYDNDQLIETKAEVDRHQVIFDDLWNRSLDRSVSERLVTARIASLAASSDDGPSAGDSR